MQDIENDTSESFQTFVYVAAVCVVVAVALHILGVVLSATTFSVVSTRDRLELISGQASNVFTAGLVLAAVVALFQIAPQDAPRFRVVVTAALIVGVVIAALAVFAIGDILSRHIPTGDGTGPIGFGLAQGGTLRARLGAALPQVGSLLVALLAIYGANQVGGFYRGVRTHRYADEFPDLPEVE